MPFYTFKCPECEKVIEVLQGMNDNPPLCEKCEGLGFRQTMMLKKLSPLVSPTGQEAIIPVAAFGCDSCGHINKEFQEAEIKSQ